MNAYIANTTVLADEALFQRLFALVNEERRQKILRMQRHHDQCLSLAAECLLIRACKDYGIDYNEQQVVYNEHQKPLWANASMYFNLSHSHHRALCVADYTPVGCDVEYISGDHSNVAYRYFTPEECEAIAACNTPEAKQHTFFRLWTLKESYMKCTGMGFHLPLNKFGINLQSGPLQLLRPTDSHSYSFYEYADDEYKYAACIQHNESHKETQHGSIKWIHCQLDMEK